MFSKDSHSLQVINGRNFVIRMAMDYPKGNFLIEILIFSI